MASSANFPTLLDVARRLDPNGSIADVAEILSQENPVYEDMPFVEGNLPTGHKTTIRSGLPEPTWRKLYQGVQPTKSTVVQVIDSCGMLEAYAEIDKALADLNGNTAAFRLTEERAHIEGMAQEVASTIFYGDNSKPEEFEGLASRYNSLSAENADNIINFGGSGSNLTSIWLVCWGNNTIHGIYPKGSKAGLQMEDKGRVTIENVDGNGGRMEAYRSHYRQDIGLVVRDWRYAARIANIPATNLTDAQMKQLVTAMIQASERIPNFNNCRPVWYVNRTIREKLRLGILEKVANNLSWDNVEGKRVMTFDDIPVKRCDAIVNTESTVA